MIGFRIVNPELSGEIITYNPLLVGSHEQICRELTTKLWSHISYHRAEMITYHNLGICKMFTRITISFACFVYVQFTTTLLYFISLHMRNSVTHIRW